MALPNQVRDLSPRVLEVMKHMGAQRPYSRGHFIEDLRASHYQIVQERVDQLDALLGTLNVKELTNVATGDYTAETQYENVSVQITFGANRNVDVIPFIERVGLFYPTESTTLEAKLPEEISKAAQFLDAPLYKNIPDSNPLVASVYGTLPSSFDLMSLSHQVNILAQAMYKLRPDSNITY